ncbi:hypothetical protein ACFPK1_18850 [Actinomycetospora rhizophila]|uniref:Anti-sigma factor n=1 Tax=Actinomycetospora rhizophila TaxID=1416876 RepID=A0ABV9ZFF1_9PSEU
MNARDPRPIGETYAELIAELVAAAPPLTAEQRDRLAVLLRRDPHTPTASRSPIPVTSAGTASRRLSAGARATRPATSPHVPAQRHDEPLRRRAFGATPEASS